MELCALTHYHMESIACHASRTPRLCALLLGKVAYTSSSQTVFLKQQVQSLGGAERSLSPVTSLARAAREIQQGGLLASLSGDKPLLQIKLTPLVGRFALRNWCNAFLALRKIGISKVDTWWRHTTISCKAVMCYLFVTNLLWFRKNDNWKIQKSWTWN